MLVVSIRVALNGWEMMERYSNTDFLQLLSLTSVALILNDLSLLAEVDAKAVI